MVSGAIWRMAMFKLARRVTKMTIHRAGPVYSLVRSRNRPLVVYQPVGLKGIDWEMNT